MLVHYGHSCLVPIQDTAGIHMLYVFVNIDVNAGHFIDTITHNFEKEKSIAFVSTVQFLTSLHVILMFENIPSIFVIFRWPKMSWSNKDIMFLFRNVVP